MDKVGSGLNGKREQHVRRCGDMKLCSSSGVVDSRYMSEAPRCDVLNWG